jgi:hypothetical protein
MPLPATSYNLATGNKWLLVLPFTKIDSSLNSKDIAFNLCNFQIPEFILGTAGYSFGGVEFPLPTFVRRENKQITFNYMLSTDWHQYKTLYRWFSMIAKEEGGASSNNLQDLLLDINVLMLSEFKNTIFNIKFFGCHITGLGALELNYQNDGENIQHSFTIAYAYYEIQNLLDDPVVNK